MSALKPTSTGTLLCVNVARAVPVPWGSMKRSAIDKRSVTGSVRLLSNGLSNDERADLKHHGSPDQAVYAYAREELDGWAKELGRPLHSGVFGENFTTQGLEVSGAVVGERWQVGSALLEVTSPRIPCRVFEGFIGEANWIKRFTQALRAGAYLRVLEEGSVQAGDAIRVVHRPAHGVTVRDVFEARSGNDALAERLLTAPELSQMHKDWAAKVARRY